MNGTATRDFRARLASGFVFLDGSMGALVQTLNTRTAWKTPEELLVTEPELIRGIHERYLEAGATVILTNTFGGNRLKLAEYGLDAKDIVRRAVALAREARDSKPEWTDRYVAFDIGPTGKLLEPMGTLTFDEAYEAFAEAAQAAEEAGADLAVIETMSDLYELKAAVLAVKENTKLPVIASATFLDTNLMLTGAPPETVVAVMEGLGVDAVGFNCGSSLENAKILAKAFVDAASIPVFMEPNAGIPVVENGKTVFKVAPAEFAETLAWCASIGVRVLGGCCGTRPEHIEAMVAACSAREPLPVVRKNRTVVTSWAQHAEIGGAAGPLIVGERINPTGKKKFKEALLAADMDYILSEAQKQIEAGANILDVNVGLPGIDEAQVMTDAVKAIQRTFPTPLQIDSSEPAVLERALRYYNGKALVNSVNGKKAVMDAVFPVVKTYGGVVVALALDEDGIAPTAEGRLAVAEKIIKTAETYGIDRKDIIVDTLTMTVSSQQKEAMETVRALPLVKNALGVKTILGVSNISFGLPQRELVNSVFFGAALSAGLDACIINPLAEQMMAVFRSYRALAGYDENCLDYIAWYSAHAPATPPAPSTAPAPATTPTPATAPDSAGRLPQKSLTDTRYAGSSLNPDNSSASSPSCGQSTGETLKTLIIHGIRDRSRAACEKLLETLSPIEIIDNHIVPALDEVGKDYERGRKFLPQLLMSADTVSRAFEAIKEQLAKTGAAAEPKGKVVMATVSGDIHDIGKNIVKAMLENYGYAVIDLGKDVGIERVLETARAEKPGILGLSALMTTTVSSMEKTIAALRADGFSGPVMVGGAVLTEEYAKKIGADYYAKDAMASVRIAREVFGA